MDGQLTARAILSAIEWQDTFTRTVGNSDPWQPGDWGSEWTIEYVNSGHKAWVDGSAGRADALASISALWNIPYAPGDPGAISYGFIQYDFWVPANVADSRPYFWLRGSGPYPVAVEVYEYGGHYEAGIYSIWVDQNGWAYAEFSPTPSTWYRVKGVFEGGPGGLIGVKIWKRDDPEPDTFSAVASFDGLEGRVALDDPDDWYDPYLSAYAPTAEALGFDNVTVGYLGQVDLPTKYVSLTAGAVKKRTMAGTAKTIDAVIAPRSFAVGAWIIGGRSGHSRFWDHHGTQPDTVVVIDGPIGPHPSGTTVHVVLASLIARIEALEDGEHSVGTFSMGAWIEGVLRASAIIQRLDGEHNFHVDAEIQGGILTSFGIDAAIIRAPTMTFSMGAYFIDLVC